MVAFQIGRANPLLGELLGRQGIVIAKAEVEMWGPMTHRRLMLRCPVCPHRGGRGSSW